VVVVAELLVAQAWAAAAVAVGEDVAALVAFGCLLHGGIPRCTDKSQSLQNKGHGSGLRRHAPGLNAKAGLRRAFFCSVSIIAVGGKLLRTGMLFVCLELGGLGLDTGFCWVFRR
jgi:hypothetical protein